MRARGTVKIVMDLGDCEACEGQGWVTGTETAYHEHFDPDGEHLGSEAYPVPVQEQCPNPRCHHGRVVVDSYWIEFEDEVSAIQEALEPSTLNGNQASPFDDFVLREAWTAAGTPVAGSAW